MLGRTEQALAITVQMHDKTSKVSRAIENAYADLAHSVSDVEKSFVDMEASYNQLARVESGMRKVVRDLEKSMGGVVDESENVKKMSDSFEDSKGAVVSAADEIVESIESIGKSEKSVDVDLNLNVKGKKDFTNMLESIHTMIDEGGFGAVLGESEEMFAKMFHAWDEGNDAVLAGVKALEAGAKAGEQFGDSQEEMVRKLVHSEAWMKKYIDAIETELEITGMSVDQMAEHVKGLGADEKAMFELRIGLDAYVRSVRLAMLELDDLIEMEKEEREVVDELVESYKEGKDWREQFSGAGEEFGSLKEAIGGVASALVALKPIVDALEFDDAISEMVRRYGDYQKIFDTTLGVMRKSGRDIAESVELTQALMGVLEGDTTLVARYSDVADKMMFFLEASAEDVAKFIEMAHLRAELSTEEMDKIGQTIRELARMSNMSGAELLEAVTEFGFKHIQIFGEDVRKRALQEFAVIRAAFEKFDLGDVVVSMTDKLLSGSFEEQGQLAALLAGDFEELRGEIEKMGLVQPGGAISFDTFRQYYLETGNIADFQERILAGFHRMAIQTGGIDKETGKINLSKLLHVQNAMEEIFGIDSQNARDLLINFTELQKAINKGLKLDMDALMPEKWDAMSPLQKIEYLFNRIRTYGIEIFHGTLKWLEPSLDWMKDLLDSFDKWWSSLEEGEKWWAKLGTIMGTVLLGGFGLKSVFDIGYKMIRGMGGGVFEGIKKEFRLVKWFDDLFDKTLSKINFRGFVKGIVKLGVSGIKGLVVGFLEWGKMFVDWGKSLAGWVKGSAGTRLVKTLVSAGKGLFRLFGRHLGKWLLRAGIGLLGVSNPIGWIITAAMAGYEIWQNWDWIKEKLVALKDWMWTNVLVPVGGYLKNLWQEMWGSFTKWVGETWDSFLNWVGGLWGDFKNWGSGLWGDFTSWMGGLWDDFGGWMSGLWGDFSGWMSEGIASMGDWLKSNISDPVVGVFDSLVLFFEEFSFGDMVYGIFESALSGISFLFDTVKGLASDMMTAVIDAWEGADFSAIAVNTLASIGDFLLRPLQEFMRAILKSPLGVWLPDSVLDPLHTFYGFSFRDEFGTGGAEDAGIESKQGLQPGEGAFVTKSGIFELHAGESITRGIPGISDVPEYKGAGDYVPVGRPSVPLVFEFPPDLPERIGDEVAGHRAWDERDREREWRIDPRDVHEITSELGRVMREDSDYLSPSVIKEDGVSEGYGRSVSDYWSQVGAGNAENLDAYGRDSQKFQETFFGREFRDLSGELRKDFDRVVKGGERTLEQYLRSGRSIEEAIGLMGRNMRHTMRNTLRDAWRDMRESAFGIDRETYQLISRAVYQQQTSQSGMEGFMLNVLQNYDRDAGLFSGQSFRNIFGVGKGSISEQMNAEVSGWFGQEGLGGLFGNKSRFGKLWGGASGRVGGIMGAGAGAGGAMAAGQIMSGLMSGDVKGMLKGGANLLVRAGLSAIPGVGQALQIASMIPGVGKWVDKGINKVVGWAGSAVKKLNPFSWGKGATIESAWHPDLLKYLYDRGMKPGDKIPKDEIYKANMDIFGSRSAPGTKDGFSMYDMKGWEEKQDRKRSPLESLQWSVNKYKQRGIRVAQSTEDALSGGSDPGQMNIDGGTRGRNIEVDAQTQFYEGRGISREMLGSMGYYDDDRCPLPAGHGVVDGETPVSGAMGDVGSSSAGRTSSYARASDERMNEAIERELEHLRADLADARDYGDDDEADDLLLQIRDLLRRQGRAMGSNIALIEDGYV